MDASQLFAGSQDVSPYGLGSSTSLLPGNLPGLADPLQQSMSLSNRSSSLTPINLTSGSGVFTVGASGEVSIDFLFDGGAYEGELAIISVEGLDRWLQSSPESFAREAALRALSNSDLGHIVISDQTEGARFSGSLPYDGDFNSGSYLGAKTFSMRPGEQFCVMLVPNGTVEDVLLGRYTLGDHTPLFSIPSWNLGGTNQFSQMLDGFPTDANAFTFEDLSLNGFSDEDYNDKVVQIKGAEGSASLLKDVIVPDKNWRNSQLGQEIEQYVVDPLDLAGNSIGKARKISVSSSGISYRGYVSAIDSDDFYSFSLGATNQYQISLDDLNSDANLELLDFRGNVIQRSNNSGILAEFLTGVLPTGGYRVRVSSDDGKGTAFNLNLQVTPQLQDITTTGSQEAVYTEDLQSNQLIHTDDDFRSGDVSRNSRPELAGIDGSGQGIVIIDSGINSSHPFFAGRIKYQRDFVRDTDDGTAKDGTGHGTLVASVAAGKDPDGQYSGVAPGADIIALKSVDDNGTVLTYDNEGNVTNGNGRWADVEQALQWVIENARNYNIVSVNMSFSVESNYSQSNSRSDLGINDELDLLDKMGIVVAAAAGNDYGLYLKPGVKYPAANQNVIAVGSVWDSFVPNPIPGQVAFVPLPKDSWISGDETVIDLTTSPDQISAFSQRLVSETMVFAPGAHIQGAGLDSTPSSPSYIKTDSGTSFASPHVAGMVALAQQLSERELPGRKPLTPAKFRELLYDTGKWIQDSNNDRRIAFDYVEVEPTPEEKAKGVTGKKEKRLTSPLPDVPNSVDKDGNPLQYKRVDMMGLSEGILALRDPSTLKIDLSPVAFDVVESTVSPGGSITVKYQIQNSELDASPPFKVYFYLADDPLIPNSLRLGDPIPVNSLAGKSSTGMLTQTFTLPERDSPYWKGFRGLPEENGDRDLGLIYMVVDRDEDVRETNEGNNGGLILGGISTDLVQINQIPRTLVIDRVLMSSTPQNGTWLYSFNASSGNSSDSFHISNREYEGNNLTVSMEDPLDNLQLSNITMGDVVNFQMGLDDDEEDVTTSRAEDRSSGSFIASPFGEQNFRPTDDWNYTIYWRIALS
jgi:hypothetical protein